MSRAKFRIAMSLSLLSVSAIACAAHAQGISEMGAAHSMGATLGAGLHSNVGNTTGGLNNAYGSLGRQMGNLTGTGGSAGGAAVDALGDPIDPRLTVKNAGKESNQYFNLAVQKQKAGKNLEAEQLYRKSLAIRQAIWGAKDPAVPKLIATIADLTKKRGDIAGAEACYRSLLKMELKNYGAGSIELVPVLEKLGVLCYQQKKYQEADNYLNQVYTQLSRKNGLAHNDTVTAAIELAQNRADANDLSSAAETLKASIAAKASDTGSPQMIKLLKTYAAVLQKQNRPDELAEVQAKLQAMAPAQKSDTAAPDAPSAKTNTTDVNVDVKPAADGAGGSSVQPDSSKTDASKPDAAKPDAEKHRAGI